MEFNLGPKVILIVCGSFKNIFFQHALESLVERTCAAQKGKEFLYKRDSMNKLVVRQSRLADPNHGTAIKSFRKSRIRSQNCHTNFGISP